MTYIHTYSKESNIVSSELFAFENRIYHNFNLYCLFIAYYEFRSWNQNQFIFHYFLQFQLKFIHFVHCYLITGNRLYPTSHFKWVEMKKKRLGTQSLHFTILVLPSYTYSINIIITLQAF
jgi:hypothetical protein